MKVKLEKSIQEFLEDFNLSDREVVIYLTLLKMGPSTIMNLSRETGVKRSTTHNNVEELIKKGLVSQTNFGERRMVVAENPEKLSFLMEQQKWKVEKMEERLPAVVEAIQKMVPNVKENTEVEVKYYEGESGFRDVCQRSIDKADGEILIISNSDEFYKVFTPEYDASFFIPARLKRKIKVRNLLVNNTTAGDIKSADSKEMRETRYLSEDVAFSTTMFIYKGEVSIMVSSEPYTAIVLTNAEISQTHKAFFDKLWALS